MTITVKLPGDQQMVLDKDHIVVGRDPGCDVRLPGEQRVQPRHAIIKKVAGRWLIQSEGDWLLQVASGIPGRKCWIETNDVIHLTEGGPDIVFVQGDLPTPSCQQFSNGEAPVALAEHVVSPDARPVHFSDPRTEMADSNPASTFSVYTSQTSTPGVPTLHRDDEPLQSPPPLPFPISTRPEQQSSAKPLVARMAIPACWAGVLVIAIGSIWFALEWNKTRKIQFAVEFGGELWGKGAKNQAVEQYRSILPILPSDDQAAVIYQRVIEFDLEKGNRESAKSLMHHALDRGLILAFDSREAAELLGEIKSKSTVEEPDAEDTTTAPVAQKTTEVRNTGNKHAKHVESTIGVTASSAPAADIPPQFDFSKVDYSIPKVDYSKGPNGEKLVVREVQNPTNGKPLTVTGFQSSNRDFVWHGLVICWYEKPRQGFRGKKMVEAYWYVDKEHGRHIEWHEDGILMYECSKKDGLRHGQSVDYDEKGQKDEEGWWLNGKKHGRFLTWKNGKPACEEQYVNGELQGIDFSKVDYTVPPYKGPKRDFTKGPNGEEVREKEERYPDGTIKRRFHFYVNSSGKEVEHGLSTEWYPNGKKKKEVTDWDGVAHGILVEWYDNGQKTREAETAKGNWNGLSTYWYPSGQMMKQGTSKDGKNHGKWTGWYENGKKQEEMTWLDGEEYGPRKVWWENGNQHLECYYVGGEVHGQVTRWRSSGVKMPANKCQAYYDGFESGAKVGQNFVAGIHKGGFVGTEILRSARDFYSEQRRTYIELRSMETQPGWSGYGDGGRTVQTLEGVIDGFRDAMLEAGVSFD